MNGFLTHVILPSTDIPVQRIARDLGRRTDKVGPRLRRIRSVERKWVVLGEPITPWDAAPIGNLGHMLSGTPLRRRPRDLLGSPLSFYYRVVAEKWQAGFYSRPRKHRRLSRLARWIILGEQRNCVTCGEDIGVSHECFCFDAHADMRMGDTTY
jgi:hypothetical protein